MSTMYKPWWSYKEIAQLYNVKVGTVKKWAIRARKIGRGPDPHQYRMVRKGRWRRVAMFRDDFVLTLFEIGHPDSFPLLQAMIEGREGGEEQSLIQLF